MHYIFMYEDVTAVCLFVCLFPGKIVQVRVNGGSDFKQPWQRLVPKLVYNKIIKYFLNIKELCGYNWVFLSY